MEIKYIFAIAVVCAVLCGVALACEDSDAQADGSFPMADGSTIVVKNNEATQTWDADTYEITVVFPFTHDETSEGVATPVDDYTFTLVNGKYTIAPKDGVTLYQNATSWTVVAKSTLQGLIPIETIKSALGKDVSVKYIGIPDPVKMKENAFVLFLLEDCFDNGKIVVDMTTDSAKAVYLTEICNDSNIVTEVSMVVASGNGSEFNLSFAITLTDAVSKVDRLNAILAKQSSDEAIQALKDQVAALSEDSEALVKEKQAELDALTEKYMAALDDKNALAVQVEELTAQVEELQALLAEKEQAIAEKSAELVALQEQFDTASAQLDEALAKVDEAKATIASLEEDKEELQEALRTGNVSAEVIRQLGYVPASEMESALAQAKADKDAALATLTADKDKEIQDANDTMSIWICIAVLGIIAAAVLAGFMALAYKKSKIDGRRFF